MPDLLKISAIAMFALTVTAATVRADDSGSDSGKRKKKGLVEEVSGQGYGTAGCGLGSILFGESPGPVQIFGATTNDIYSNNTFAGTSGTSNCDEGDSAGNAQAFIDSNKMAMQDDIARGSGETLTTFYDIVGCEQRPAVSATLQKNYQMIFTQGANSRSILRSIRSSIRESSNLTKACAKLG